jgi:hypothetical protein
VRSWSCCQALSYCQFQISHHSHFLFPALTDLSTCNLPVNGQVHHPHTLSNLQLDKRLYQDPIILLPFIVLGRGMTGLCIAQIQQKATFYRQNILGSKVLGWSSPSFTEQSIFIHRFKNSMISGTRGGSPVTRYLGKCQHLPSHTQTRSI